MSSTDLSGKLFQKYMMEMAKDLVWKNGYEAALAEKDCDRIYTDRYASSARKLLEKYSVSELKAITDYTPAQLTRFLNNAPSALHKYIQIFWDYEEPNTYFRILYGKPPLNCDPKYLVYPKINNQWGLDPNNGIHDASISILMIIESEGGLDYYKNLVSVDKTFEYVNHMTAKKVYPFVARLAQSFDLLYVPTTEIGNLSRDFKETYQLCRDFMVLRYYSEAYRYKYQYYEGMMGMSILFQAMQQMHVKYLDADITRDFYDLDSIRVIYDAYSVPFYENIPTVYHQKIVKLMNRLIAYKGSNQVFFDLCALFDCESLDVYKYYLVKEQKFNDDSEPIFVRTQDGGIDYQATYNIYFSKGTINGDPFTDILDVNNHLDYFPVTNADPYWFNDTELLEKVYQTEYNYTETKYIGLQMVFSLTAFLFETCYFMQMLIDNRNSVSTILVSHGKLGMEIDLFTLVVYVHAIIYQRLGYAGNITDSFDARARIIGFNFKDDINTIIEDINSTDYLSTEDASTLINALQQMTITDISSCAVVYDNIKSLYRIMDNLILRCKDPNVYFAYKHIYKLLLSTEQIKDVFRKSDGSIATTVMELLEDINISLALRIQGMSETELTQELQYSLIALEKAGSDLKYLQNYGGSIGKIISDYLYKLIRVFKSAKVDLVDFKTIYVVDGRCTNLIKFMTKLRCTGITHTIEDDKIDLVDHIKSSKIYTELSTDCMLHDESMTLLLMHIVNDESFGLSFKDTLSVVGKEPSDPILGKINIVDHIYSKSHDNTHRDKSLSFTDKLIQVE